MSRLSAVPVRLACFWLSAGRLRSGPETRRSMCVEIGNSKPAASARRETKARYPRVENGAPRSLTNTKGEAGCCSRLSRRSDLISLAPSARHSLQEFKEVLKNTSFARSNTVQSADTIGAGSDSYRAVNYLWLSSSVGTTSIIRYLVTFIIQFEKSLAYKAGRAGRDLDQGQRLTAVLARCAT